MIESTTKRATHNAKQLHFKFKRTNVQAKIRRIKMTKAIRPGAANKNKFVTADKKEKKSHFIYKLKEVSPKKRKGNKREKICRRPVLEKPEFYAPIGPGEFGKEYDLENLETSEMKEMSKGLQVYHFNKFVSDKISLHRTLEDHRPKE